MPFVPSDPALRSKALRLVAEHVATHGQRGALTAAAKAVGVSMQSVRNWVIKEPPAGYDIGALPASSTRRPQGGSSETEVLRALLHLTEQLDKARARVSALEAEYAVLRGKL